MHSILTLTTYCLALLVSTVDGFDTVAVAVGASMVWGVHSSKGNGWRRDVYNAVTNAGNNITMVGHMSHGDMTQPWNEGYPGYNISGVHTEFAAHFQNLQQTPTLIILLVGTNDLYSNCTDIPTAPARYSALLSTCYSLCPSCTIIASSLPPSGWPEHNANIDVFNAAIRRHIESRAAKGQRILFSDGNSGVSVERDISWDHVHPNDLGYAIIGSRIAKEVGKAGEMGWI